MKIRQVETRNELYLKYPGQLEHQDVFLNLDTETGEAWLAPDAEIGGAVTMRVWKGIQIRWKAPLLLQDDANTLLEELRPKLQNVLDAYNNNEGLEEAYESISEHIEGEWENAAPIYHVEDWLYNVKSDLILLSDEELDDEIDGIIATANVEGVILEGDVREIIERWKADEEQNK